MFIEEERKEYVEKYNEIVLTKHYEKFSKSYIL
jgi:hypothetical protein